MTTLVYMTDPAVLTGGFGDRITGMAALHKVAESFNLDFKIHHVHPFDLFDIFPDGKQLSKFDLLESQRSEINAYNLIDKNFESGINDFGRMLVGRNDLIALVFINNIKPFNFNPILNKFTAFQYQLNDADLVQRHVLYEFGRKYLRFDATRFSPYFQDTLSKFSNRVIGLHIRVGGNNPNWHDPAFKVPSINQINSKLTDLRKSCISPCFVR